MLAQGAYTGNHKFLSAQNVEDLCESQKKELWDEYWRLRYLQAELTDNFIQESIQSCTHDGLPIFDESIPKKLCMLVNDKKLCSNVEFLKIFKENLQCKLK